MTQIAYETFMMIKKTQLHSGNTEKLEWEQIHKIDTTLIDLPDCKSIFLSNASNITQQISEYLLTMELNMGEEIPFVVFHNKGYTRFRLIYFIEHVFHEQVHRTIISQNVLCVNITTHKNPYIH